jgi:hypothetical protein
MPEREVQKNLQPPTSRRLAVHAFNYCFTTSTLHKIIFPA